MTKVKLFTHTDLDAAGCAIVALNVFGYDNVDITYCDYHNVNEKVSNYLDTLLPEELHEHNRIYITDISVNEEVAARLDEVYKGLYNIGIMLLDHHETANWLNKYDWARVIQVDENDGINTSGTSLFSGYLEEQGYAISSKLNHFVEIVRRYDTWDWANIYNDTYPKKANDLFWLYGRERFVKTFHPQILTIGFFLGPQDEFVLELEQERINRRVNKALKQLTIKNVGRYNIGVVFAEEYQNEIAHEIHKQHPQLDLVAIVNMSSRKVSYRTEREDIDVGQFAQYFGGGGRPQTAGSQITDEKFDAMMSFIFN